MVWNGPESRGIICSESTRDTCELPEIRSLIERGNHGYKRLNKIIGNVLALCCQRLNGGLNGNVCPHVFNSLYSFFL